MRTYTTTLIMGALKILVALLLLSSCATRAPTIAHAHIGHAMDGWAETSNQVGLLVTAENAARAAVNESEAAVAEKKDLARIKFNIAQIISHTNPNYFDSQPSTERKRYGVKNALAETAHHITFAAKSPDASANVINSAQQFSRNTNYLLNRCDTITLLANEVLKSQSAEEANILSGELLKLTRANLYGDDSNGDGIIGSVPEEYGLKQLRDELLTMINREGSNYRTVDTWYLLNLIKLDTGVWVYKEQKQDDGRIRNAY